MAFCAGLGLLIVAGLGPGTPEGGGGSSVDPGLRWVVFPPKAEIDEAAKAAGFVASDFPYHSPLNGCGPDGWRNWLVPDWSHMLWGCDLSTACDRHDADYMTVGISQQAADDRFRQELHAAVVRYVEEAKARVAAEQAARIARHHITSLNGAWGGIVGAVAQHAPEVVVADESGWFGWAREGWGYAWGYGWGWTKGAYASRGDFANATGAAWSWTWDHAWGSTTDAAQGIMLTQTQVDFMHWEADMYADTVQRFGSGFYERSQEEQKRYDEWFRVWMAGRTP